MQLKESPQLLSNTPEVLEREAPREVESVHLEREVLEREAQKVERQNHLEAQEVERSQEREV